MCSIMSSLKSGHFKIDAMHIEWLDSKSASHHVLLLILILLLLLLLFLLLSCKNAAKRKIK